MNLDILSTTGTRPVLAAVDVPPMDHIQEMCTPTPEVILAEFRAQKGIFEAPAEPPADVPEAIAEEPAAEAEEAAGLTPRSGETQP